eukprot:366280-Chlamydomonas_euryale.AAC.1
MCGVIRGASSIGPTPGDPWRSTQIPQQPISIGVDQTPGTECPAASSAPPSAPPGCQTTKLSTRGRNGNVLEHQPRKDENSGEVCDLRGLWTHFAPPATAQWE